jgi:hypothetical protein
MIFNVVRISIEELGHFVSGATFSMPLVPDLPLYLNIIRLANAGRYKWPSSMPPSPTSRRHLRQQS